MTPRKSLPVLILALLFSASACTDRPGTEQEVEIAVPHASAKECKPSIHPFWAKFREAVLKEDWEAVAGMTEFPLPVYGLGDRKRLLSRQEFIKHLPQFLEASPGEYYSTATVKHRSMSALIKAVPTLEKRACGDFENLLAIGLWEFYLRPEGWRLGRIELP